MKPSTRSVTNAPTDRDATAVPPLAFRFEPAPHDWHPAPPPLRDVRTLKEVAALSERWSHLAGIVPLEPRELLIATGHQAWLWHPGILAKDIAAQSFAASRNGAWLHLVVDHDVTDAAVLPVPVREGEALRVEPLVLGRTRADVPTGFQPAIDLPQMLTSIDAFEHRFAGAIAIDLLTLRSAATASESAKILAEQMTAMVAHIMQPLVGPFAVIGSSDLLSLPVGRAMVDDMLADPQRCALAYNAAVSARPGAGIAPLHAGVDIIELPLWHVAANEPRQRVYAQTVGPRAELITGEGAAIKLDDPRRKLAPKALMLTAIMRAAVADLFIHGAGGGIYDRVMEDWWHRWRGESVAPMAVASADLRLAFDVPLDTEASRDRAVWLAHHLPHNMDRHAPLDAADAAMADEKRRILQHMDDDRDGARRAAAFDRLHAINATLAGHHRDLLRTSEQAVARAAQGVANREVAMRRDWPLHWYTARQLEQLCEGLRTDAAQFKPSA